MASCCQLRTGAQGLPMVSPRTPLPSPPPSAFLSFLGASAVPNSPRVMPGYSVSSRSVSSSVPGQNITRTAGGPSPGPAERRCGAPSLRCSQIRVSVFSARSKTGQRGPEWNSPPREISLGTTQNPLGSRLGLCMGRRLDAAMPSWSRSPAPTPRLQTYLVWNGNRDPRE